MTLRLLSLANGEGAGSEGQLLGTISNKSLFALRGTFEIEEGMPGYVATEVKTTLEAAGYRMISQPTSSVAV